MRKFFTRKKDKKEEKEKKDKKDKKNPKDSVDPKNKIENVMDEWMGSKKTPTKSPRGSKEKDTTNEKRNSKDIQPKELAKEIPKENPKDTKVEPPRKDSKEPPRKDSNPPRKDSNPPRKDSKDPPRKESKDLPKGEINKLKKPSLEKSNSENVVEMEKPMRPSKEIEEIPSIKLEDNTTQLHSVKKQSPKRDIQQVDEQNDKGENVVDMEPKQLDMDNLEENDQISENVKPNESSNSNDLGEKGDVDNNDEKNKIISNNKEPKGVERNLRKKVLGQKKDLTNDFKMERERTLTKLNYFNTDKMRKQEALETDETRELNQYEPKNNEHTKIYTSPDKIYSNFYNVTQLGRNLGVVIELKEFVLFGARSHGKSTVVEAILGYPIGGIGYGGKTNCPIYYHMINNSQCEEPKITFKKIEGLNMDIVISSVKQAQYEISARVEQFSKEPIHIMFEYKYCLDCVLIDTPGIPLLPPFQHMKEINEIIEECARKPERTLLVVEEAIDWESISDTIIQFVKKHDPFFTRTVFINTKFNSFLQSCTTPRQLLSYFLGENRRRPGHNSFFVTAFSEIVQNSIKSSQDLKKTLWQAQKRDLNVLQQLMCDKDKESKVGLLNLRHHLHSIILKELGEALPRYLRNIEKSKKEMEKKISEISIKSKNVDPVSIRSKGIEISSQFCNFITELLIKGSSLVDVDQFGETTREEVDNSKTTKWQSNLYISNKLERKNGKIPYNKNKLLGGQQFDRLLTEMSNTINNIQFKDLPSNIEAKHSECSNQRIDFLYNCCENVSHASFEVFTPLFPHYCARGSYILKRLFDIFLVHFHFSELPFLTNYLKENFYRFVDANSNLLLTKCMEELMEPDTLLWKTKNDISFLESANSEDSTGTSSHIFNDIKGRMIKNIVLKFYRYFLDPSVSELSGYMKEKILTLDEESINQIFEIDSISEELLVHKKKLLLKFDEIDNMEVKCEEVINDFLFVSREIISF